jgi:pilus assembly protein Flp/PilA
MRVPRFAGGSFRWLKCRTLRLAGDTRGATAVEYAVIAALISVAIIGGVTYFGSQLSNSWLYLANTVNPKLGQ